MENLRTYKLTHFANENKQRQVFDVLYEYRKACTQIAKVQWRLIFNGEKLNKMADLRYVNSIISERYKRNCAYQVDGSLQSFISNRQNDFSRKVMKSTIEGDLQKALLQINRRKLWFKTEDKNFTSEQLFLARKIFKQILKRNRKPNFKKGNMLLNENVASIEIADKSLTTDFDYWIKFSTLINRKPILIPIKSNKYFDGIKGNLKHISQFNFKNNEFSVSFVKDVPMKNIEFKSEKISLDFGLKSLFTVQDGKMFGKQFYDKLKEFDLKITTLQAELNRQKIKLSTNKRYQNLTKKLRDYIKNEVNRVFNRIIKLYAPKQINLERLNFQGQNLSKKLNRILANCGRGVVNRKIVQIKEDYGIATTLVNPAYTSQECSGCHYVDKNNRKTQSKFECKFCGLRLNADVNGARTVDFRSSDSKLSNIFTHRKQILQQITSGFLERNPCLHSKATRLLEQNPYFADELERRKQII